MILEPLRPKIQVNIAVAEPVRRNGKQVLNRRVNIPVRWAPFYFVQGDLKISVTQEPEESALVVISLNGRVLTSYFVKH